MIIYFALVLHNLDMNKMCINNKKKSILEYTLAINAKVQKKRRTVSISFFYA